MSRIDAGVARHQVHWRAHGSGSALVLLNGYGAAGTAWPLAWQRTLRARHRVVTPDLRGSGRSRFSQTPFSIADLADDVVAVLDQAEIERGCILGLSMGGMVAQELALRAPERVAGLVLAGSRPPVPRFTRPPLRSSLRLLLPSGPGRTLADYYHRQWTSATAPGFADDHPHLIDELVDQTLEGPTSRRMLRHQVAAMMAWGHAERLERLRVPSAVVHGSLDRFSPVANGRALAELIPDATYDEVAGVGHLLPLEAPDRLDAAIADVLAQR
ncbi:MAG: alpha/beta hydrolase [Chloroflexota bacterium]